MVQQRTEIRGRAGRDANVRAPDPERVQRAQVGGLVAERPHGFPGLARGQGHGREALALLTDWLFGHAAAEVVEAPTDPANVAMQTVFERVGWRFAGPLTEFDREWWMYRITRRQWQQR